MKKNRLFERKAHSGLGLQMEFVPATVEGMELAMLKMNALRKEDKQLEAVRLVMECAVFVS